MERPHTRGGDGGPGKPPRKFSLDELEKAGPGAGTMLSNNLFLSAGSSLFLSFSFPC